MGFLNTLYKSCLRRLQTETDMKKVRKTLDVLATSETDVYYGGRLHGKNISREMQEKLSALDIPILNTMRERIRAAGKDEKDVILSADSEWAMYFVERLSLLYKDFHAQACSADDPFLWPILPEPPSSIERCQVLKYRD